MKKGKSTTIRTISNNADYGEKHTKRSFVGYGLVVPGKLRASGPNSFIH